MIRNLLFALFVLLLGCASADATASAVAVNSWGFNQ